MYQRDSHENVKEFIVTSPHIMPRPIVSQNVNANLKSKPKNECNYHKMFASQQNITTGQDMSHTCHMRHVCMPVDQTTKK